MKSDKKRPKPRKKKSWLAPVAGATKEEYREMERRVFNARKLLPRATELDLRLMGNARAGSPANQLLTSWDDPLVPDNKKAIEPLWVGTRFEKPLKQIVIEGASEAENMRLWDLVYGHLHRIVRDSFGLSVNDGWRWLKGDESERKEIRSQREEPSKHLTLSKEVAVKRQVARQLAGLARKIEPFVPPLANLWQSQSGTLTEDATQLTEFARSQKRHSEHSETWQICAMMESVYSATGKRHDQEISSLLKAAGLSQMTPEALRTLRARCKSKSKSS
ncbi:MAG TPA: hypothetical protein VMW54_13830 [Terriglobia bacterium]|nr:hypothetical protein [Terriglobia bacterium]